MEIAEFEALANSIAEKRGEIDALSTKRKMVDAELGVLENKMMAMLDEVDKPDYHANVGTFYKMSRESVKTPKEITAKQDLFNYLRAKGIFEEMVNVNSMTLNAFYKAEKKAAEERGEWGFVLPGVGEPTTDIVLGFRRKK